MRGRRRPHRPGGTRHQSEWEPEIFRGKGSAGQVFRQNLGQRTLGAPSKNEITLEKIFIRTILSWSMDGQTTRPAQTKLSATVTIFYPKICDFDDLRSRG
jgi:hypothetical protein